jgi:hypothetical protein
LPQNKFSAVQSNARDAIPPGNNSAFHTCMLAFCMYVQYKRAFKTEEFIREYKENKGFLPVLNPY